ncbi:MAG: hypothetical protein ORN85_08070 [Sediminibacterium sp.]|nr:hypothetical protein [Sediminibacterium sp.]
MNNRLENLLKLLPDQPHDSFLNHAIALEYLKINELSKARQHFETVLEYNENYIGTYYHLANLLIELSELDLAKIYFEKGMEIAKSLKDSHSFNELLMVYDENFT